MKEKRKIKNPEHYFNKYVSCEVKNDKKKCEKIRENECSLDEKLAKGQILPCFICNQYNELFENIIFDKDNLTWLECIENERLYFALSQVHYSCERQNCKRHDRHAMTCPKRQ